MEILPSFICYSNYFINSSNHSHLLQIIPTHTTFSLLFQGFYTPYPTSGSYISPSRHGTDQANFNSSPSQIIMQQHHPFTYPASQITSLSNFALANCNPSPGKTFPQHSLVHVLHWFLCHVLPIRPHATSIRYTKAYSKPGQLNLLSFFYKYFNTLMWVKNSTHQKAESLRVSSFSKSNNTVYNNLIFCTKYAEFSAK